MTENNQTTSEQLDLLLKQVAEMQKKIDAMEAKGRGKPKAKTKSAPKKIPTAVSPLLEDVSNEGVWVNKKRPKVSNKPHRESDANLQINVSLTDFPSYGDETQSTSKPRPSSLVSAVCVNCKTKSRVSTALLIAGVDTPSFICASCDERY